MERDLAGVAPLDDEVDGTHRLAAAQSAISRDSARVTADEKERLTYFCHVRDLIEEVFYQLQPGMRVAFEVFSDRDGKLRAHRVQLLG